MSLIPVIPATDPTSDDTMATSGTSKRPHDRRTGTPAGRAGRTGVERRQFGSTHAGLSGDGRDLASAIDNYKLQHHRRYITCDEMLVVLKSLGYEKPPARS